MRKHPVDTNSRLWSLTAILGWMRTLLVFDQRIYQPEKYYMRGAGPACRAKAAALRAAASAIDGLRRGA